VFAVLGQALALCKKSENHLLVIPGPRAFKVLAEIRLYPRRFCGRLIRLDSSLQGQDMSKSLFEPSPGSVELRDSAVESGFLFIDLRIEIAWIEFHQHVAFLHLLVVRNQHARYPTRYFGGDIDAVHVDERVVGRLVRLEMGEEYQSNNDSKDQRRRPDEA
jgi:hypothetical protein